MARRKSGELSDPEQQLFLEIRQMFSAFEGSYEQLEDKCGINKDDLRFRGFDANDPYESRFNGGSGLNSHGTMMPYYKRLLEAWKHSPDRANLTKDDLHRILEAAALKPC